MCSLPELKNCCRCLTEYPATADHFHRFRRRGRDELTSQCKSCRKEMQREQYLKKREHYIAIATERTRIRRQRPEVREKERVASRLAKRETISDPVEREKHRKRIRGWFRKNRDRINFLPSRSKAIRAFYTSNYKAKKIQATPVWADLKMISDFYKEAQRLTDLTGIPHEVDHIVPLRHKKASGLHVPENLKVVTRAFNRSKSNRYISL